MLSKSDQICKSAIEPLHIKCDLKTFNLASLNTKFDVILVDPPWKMYSDRNPAAIQNRMRETWTLSEMYNLKMQEICENPSFLFLWCLSGKQLNEGRKLLKMWGFKRCEVIVWLKTNKRTNIKLSVNRDGSNHRMTDFMWQPNENTFCKNEHDSKLYPESLFVRSCEHCLMGIRGQVRRSTDGHLIHANTDTGMKLIYIYFHSFVSCI